MPQNKRKMEEEGVRKIITIGTAGILQARTNLNLYRFQSTESKKVDSSRRSFSCI